MVHLTVMGREAVKYLGCGPGRVYVDGTLGGGGHAVEILKATGPDGRVIGLDVDDEAIENATRVLKPFAGSTLILRENFKDMKSALARNGIKKVDGVLLDLGVSSYQLEGGERGFGFSTDSRLDMRMDRRQDLTAHVLVNELEEKELASIIRTYGEERMGKRIARAIVRARGKAPIDTTRELAEIIKKCFSPARRHGMKTHCATKTFQALRIVVNKELESLKEGLSAGVDVLASGGRMVVISFHSLEDRLVKNTFRELSAECICPSDLPVCICDVRPVVKRVTKKVVKAGADEISINPRARSARLRAVEKC